MKKNAAGKNAMDPKPGNGGWSGPDPASFLTAFGGAQTMPVAMPVTRSVLVMDDDPIMRTAAGLMLEAIGYKVFVAINGEEAIEAFRNALERGSPFDAVMLDLNIPRGMGGRETVVKLLEMDPDVKAIVASGDVEDPAMRHFRKFGFSGALSKPFSLEELEETLRRATENAETAIEPLLHRTMPAA